MSSFNIKGFIEGFYGRVWDDEKRRRVLKLVSEGGMNAYFYSPKDDPFLRQKWRCEYGKFSLDKFSELFRYTKELGIELYYCLSPGLDIVYSSEEDLNVIAEKFNSIYAIGVRCFGLFLDDIPDKLTDERDIAAYGNVCDAHISLINRLSEIMPYDTRLVICPMQYHGSGSEPYITALCRGIPEKVSVFWTGKKICSPELTSADAEFFMKNTGRKPLYWDNYPVNDAEMYGEMHIGAYLNRSSDLCDYSEGIVSNVMEYPLSSAISLLTICDYLSDPENYSPESSFKNAVEKVTGDSYETWMPFFDHTCYSCLNDCFSVYLSDKLCDIRAELMSGSTDNAVAILADLINEYEKCSAAMRKNTELFHELKKWISRFDEITMILKNSKEFIISGSAESKETLLNSMKQYNENAYKLAGFGLREAVETLTGEFTI